ncbi:MAG: polysaccharide deacetylase [Alphaproteobacteria bacterium RIFCSPHIGHO2_12_FULL_63_12]|nr:MAG: polysaccharide deacetylase [Alphaproteobacteria bacterium RIFCSPHIGHO2_12_FULL_63_12]
MPQTRSSDDKPQDGARRFAMSVDVEDYFQVWALSPVIRRDDWDDHALRVDASTRRVLDLFDQRQAKATFFTLGWVAERAPNLIREIVARGHELASHGYDHVKVFDQTPDEFRADVEKTKRILEDAGGVAVAGFRAAGFSIDQRTPWAHEILAETGHLYSSSSHPIRHDHYGDPNAPRAPHRLGGLIEAPVATTEVFGRRISSAGGGWFRAAPYALSRRLIARAADSLDGPTIFYFHPWEIDAEQPRVDGLPVKSRLRHYLNLDRMEAKLDRLLSDFDWGRIDDALGVNRLRGATA